MHADLPHTGTVIVGGGLAGLTAAAYLARAGRRVTVFERTPSLGGRSATRYQAGFAFNRGIHAIYSGGATSDVLAELGVTYSAGSPEQTFVLDEGRLRPFPASPLALLGSTLLGPADKLALIRVFAGLPKVDAHALAHVSVQDWLDGAAQRPRVCRLLRPLAQTLVYTTALDLVSAEVLVDKLQRTLKHPVHYVDGGWQTLVDGLRRVAMDAGAQILSGVPVEAVEVVDGRVAGVRVRDGQRHSAGAVILATSPHEAARVVDNGTSRPLRQLVDALTPAYLACLDLALTELPDPRFPIVQSLERPLFFSTQSRYARVAPDGAALVHAFKQLDPRQPSDAGQAEQELEGLLDAAQPGWRDRVVKRVFLPHILAVGALPTAANGGFAGRPGPRVAGLDNLYLAGDWVGPRGFLADASFASARAAAQLVLSASLPDGAENQLAPTAA
jgi:phytoene dehydrogenase-like protein